MHNISPYTVSNKRCTILSREYYRNPLSNFTLLNSFSFKLHFTPSDNDYFTPSNIIWFIPYINICFTPYINICFTPYINICFYICMVLHISIYI